MRRQRAIPGYTLTAVRSRRNQQEQDPTHFNTKVEYVFDYVRHQFDAFVNHRIQNRLNATMEGDPTFYISLDWNHLYPILNERYDTTFEARSGFSATQKRQLFKMLKYYLGSLYDATDRNPLLRNVFSYPSFDYKIGQRRHLVRLSNLEEMDEDIEPQTLQDARLEGTIDNVLDGGSDLNLVTYGQIYSDQFNLADSIGLILPYKKDNTGALTKDFKRSSLRQIKYRSRRYGAFFPFLIREEYQYFYQWLKDAQITYDPEDPILNEHCLIYCIQQMDIDDDFKQRLITRFREHSSEIINGVKTKTFISMRLFQNIFDSLNTEYNLCINVSSSQNTLIKYGKSDIKRNKERWVAGRKNIYVYFDESHYMIDYKLPFTKAFVKNFEFVKKCVEDAPLKMKRSNAHTLTRIEDYFTMSGVDKGRVRFRPTKNKEIPYIYLRELIMYMKLNNKFVVMSETQHNSLMTLPLTGEERGLSIKCNDQSRGIFLKDNKQEKDYQKVFYFDFESIPDDDHHIPFLCVLVEADYKPNTFPNIRYGNVPADTSKPVDINYDGHKRLSFVGYDCVKDMFAYLSSIIPPNWQSKDPDNPYFQILCYAHNLMYDSRFLRGHALSSFIEKSGRCYSQIHIFGNTKIIFKDFLALSNCALKKLPSWYPHHFKELDLEKEIYFYDLIPYFVNKDATSDEDFIIEKIPISELYALLIDLNHPKEEVLSFIDHYMRIANKNYFFEQGYFNFTSYTLYYCHQDCNVLKVAHQLYRYEIKQSILDMDIDHYLTAPALAKTWFKREIFCPLKFVAEVCGELQEFILKACHGGRCMTARNHKFHITDEILNIDAVSLYPSAMANIYVPIGMPTIIPDAFLHTSSIFDINNPHPLFDMLFKESQVKISRARTVAHFIVEIEIMHVGMLRDFPCIVRHTKHGKDNSNTTGVCFVDNIGLLDLINHQLISYRVIRGVWWHRYVIATKTGTRLFHCTRSYSIQDKIRELFELRKKYKKEGNPQEKIVKLLLNSGYGSMMQKPIKTQIEIYELDELREVFEDDISKMKYYHQVFNEHFEATDTYICGFQKDTEGQYNMAYLAALVLSMSKHIMNNLMYRLENAGVPIYYTDTDSIHVNRQKWLDLFANDMNIVGNDLGQFHNDYDGFGLGIYDDEHPPVKNDYDLYAVEGYYLAKKIYCEKVTSVTYPDRFGVFFRLKGIPDICIIKFAERNFNGDIMQIYDALYHDYGITFDIAEHRTVFRFTCDSIFNLNDFTRTVKCRYYSLDPSVLTIHRIEPDESEYAIAVDREIPNVVSSFTNANPEILYPNEEVVNDMVNDIPLAYDEIVNCRTRFYIEPEEEMTNYEAQEIMQTIDPTYEQPVVEDNKISLNKSEMYYIIQRDLSKLFEQHTTTVGKKLYILPEFQKACDDYYEHLLREYVMPMDYKMLYATILETFKLLADE